MAKVLIAPSPLDGVDAEFVSVLKKAGHELIYPGKGQQLTEDELMTWLRGTSAVLAGSEPYSAKIIGAHPQLRVIARVGVGYDAVDLKASTANKTAVTIAPGTNHGSVAEHAFCLMLALAKNLVPQHKAIEQGKFPRGTNIPLRGRTLGIAGLGRAGKAIATRAIAFEMKVIAFEPFPDKEFIQKHGIELKSWEDVLKQSDYLSLHLPYNQESHHIINKNTLSLMKPTAFLINTARGGVVKTEDLYQALLEKKIAGAGLDVFEEEPPGKLPLFDMPNVALTTHMAGVDIQSRDDMALSAAHAVADLLSGKWPAEKIVNPDVKPVF